MPCRAMLCHAVLCYADRGLPDHDGAHGREVPGLLLWLLPPRGRVPPAHQGTALAAYCRQPRWRPPHALPPRPALFLNGGPAFAVLRWKPPDSLGGRGLLPAAAGVICSSNTTRRSKPARRQAPAGPCLPPLGRWTPLAPPRQWSSHSTRWGCHTRRCAESAQLQRKHCSSRSWSNSSFWDCGARARALPGIGWLAGAAQGTRGSWCLAVGSCTVVKASMGSAGLSLGAAGEAQAAGGVSVGAQASRHTLRAPARSPLEAPSPHPL